MLSAVGFAAVLFATPSAATVTMQHHMYMPAAVTVLAGDTVSFVNEDVTPHTITGTSGPEHLDSPEMLKGDRWEYTFAVPGTYDYFCSLHPDMKATVVVQPAPVAATVHRAVVPPRGRTPLPSTATTTLTTVETDPQPAFLNVTKVSNRPSPALVLGALWAAYGVFLVLVFGGLRSRRA